MCTHNHRYVPQGGQLCVSVCVCVHVLTIGFLLICLGLSCFLFVEYFNVFQTVIQSVGL